MKYSAAFRFLFIDFTRCSHPQEILVGPLNSLPEHPNGNGPQDMNLKGPGGYRKSKGMLMLNIVYSNGINTCLCTNVCWK